MSKGQYGQLRIIAGEWRSRKLRVIDRDTLRPTPDRVRETLFNWLQPKLAGSRCLDLFAGSGALGFEAASRGACHVLMMEQDIAAVAQLENNIHQLQATQIEIRHTDSIKAINASATSVAGGPYDIVFIDPPYHSGLVEKCAQLLERGDWLRDNASIYIECAADEAVQNLPVNWQCHRNQRAGRVNYFLYTRQVKECQ